MAACRPAGVADADYLSFAIDRATRWVFMHIYGKVTEASSVDFLHSLNAFMTKLDSTDYVSVATLDYHHSGRHF
ncbi:hypothetical protein DIR46_15805 [Massilia oculi]|uniref:Integrase catalytic domain-containing protein n=1 Tax=Massilia oculi TaxID=945844 RepID=A0A2S2DK52_9BURK|nr:hypothetical protein DIR46_15805 [Massilia oculi]